MFGHLRVGRRHAVDGGDAGAQMRRAPVQHRARRLRDDGVEPRRLVRLDVDEEMGGRVVRDLFAQLARQPLLHRGDGDQHGHAETERQEEAAGLAARPRERRQRPAERPRPGALQAARQAHGPRGGREEDAIGRERAGHEPERQHPVRRRRDRQRGEQRRQPGGRQDGGRARPFAARRLDIAEERDRRAPRGGGQGRQGEDGGCERPEGRRQ